MGLRIATNVQSLASQRFLEANNKLQNRALERLASGTRINRAADDAAGLAISERLRANIRSLGQAIRNANDGVSMIQVAEGALNEISNILIRSRELSIQAASDTVSDRERAFIDKEVSHLMSEVVRISASTEYNGSKLLTGDRPNMDFQIGINNNPVLDRLHYDTSEQEIDMTTLGLEDVSVLTKENAQENLEDIDHAINIVSRNRASLGALQNRLTSTLNNSAIYRENLLSAKSRIRDTDMATESTNLVKQSILTQSNVAMLSQANQMPQQALQLL